MQAAEAAASQARSQLSKVEQQNQQLGEELSTLKGLRDKEVAAARAEVEEIERQLDAQNAELSQEAETLRQELARRDEDLERLQCDVADAEENAAKLEAELETLRPQVFMRQPPKFVVLTTS